MLMMLIYWAEVMLMILIYWAEVMLMMLIYWAKAFLLLKNTEALVVASRKNGLEVNADKSQYMVIFRDKNAGQNKNINTEKNNLLKGQNS